MVLEGILLVEVLGVLVGCLAHGEVDVGIWVLDEIGLRRNLVGDLVVAGARDLEVLVLDQLQHLLNIGLGDLACTEGGPQVLWAEVAEGAAMVIARRRVVAGDDLDAAVGGVVGALALLSVVVADVVGVVLAELLVVHPRLEGTPPVEQSLIKGQTDGLNSK